MVRPKAQKKQQSRGVDFKKYKRKLGRKLPPPKNTTNTEIKSKAIILPEQSVASDKAGLALSKKGQSLKELLQQTSHHNVKIRRDALVGVREILLKDPTELKDHKLAIIEKLRERINDDDKVVRETLYQLFKSIILPGCKEENQGALISITMAYIFNAMTHLTLDVRLMAFKFFDLVIQNFPPAFFSYAEQVLENYMDILQKIHFHIEDKSKLKTALSGLLRCLSLLPSNKNGCQSSEQIMSETLVLHAFQIEVPNDPTEHVKIGGKLNDLLHLLVTCFNGLISVVHSQRVLDSHTFDCMLCVLQSIDLVVQNYVHRVSKFQTGLHSPMSFSAAKMSKQERDFPPFLDKLFVVFPIRPLDYLSEKDDQRYLIMNTIISQIYFTLRQQICPSLGLPDEFLNFVVDVLPKIRGVEPSNKALNEKHLVPLVPFIPRLIATVESYQKHALLQAFTTAFKNSYADSLMKMSCLKALEEMLASEEESLYSDSSELETIDYQKTWINETGLLLNIFGKGHPSKLHEVLIFLVRLGQIGLQNNDLVEEYDTLQDKFQTFFCICTDEGERCYGPFMELPEDCQFLSICCLSYFHFMKPDLLSSLALCCLSGSLKPSILTHIVGVVRSSYRNGHVDIADYISFCITLLSQSKIAPEELCTTLEKEAVSSSQKTFRYITNVILTSLIQMGDQSILLQMSESFLFDILSQNLPLENACAVMRILVALDSRPTKLSEESVVKLGNIVLIYMLNIALLFPDHEKEQREFRSSCTCRYYLVPCFHLLNRNIILVKHLLTKMSTQLTQDCPRKIKAAVCLFSMLSMDLKMQKVLSSCKPEVDDILQKLLTTQSSMTANMNIEQRHMVGGYVESLRKMVGEISGPA
ncbi:hypothetical protein RND81_06G202800 [Saponaria officinalis]|uniref:Pre-rRNA-processing protein Ipi1 N-terminal domain-containing protein n=1 Tax=Saponaria officinalis TaxID=3572 RepID=A0AAW1KDN6_SAPOF